MPISTNFQSLFEGEAHHLLREQYLACGCVCAVTTNSEDILAAVRQSFSAVAPSGSAAEFELRLWVDPRARTAAPWPQPYFRGLDHLIFAAFDAENTVLVDLSGRRAVGRLSPAMAADSAYLLNVVLPTLVGTFTYTIPVTPLHCACLERGGRALLLTGPSGSGKSTLALALAQSGFGFLSDEWTYFSWRAGRLLAWSLSTALKLLPSALEHFPQLAHIQTGISLNGELAYEIEPDLVFGIQRAACAEPDWLILLERQDTPSFRVSRVSPAEVVAEFKEDAEFFAIHGFAQGRDLLVKTVERLGRISCWRLRYGGKPSVVARALSQFIESGLGHARSGKTIQELVG